MQLLLTLESIYAIIKPIKYIWEYFIYDHPLIRIKYSSFFEKFSKNV